MLKKCDLILAVSHFTKNKLESINKIPSSKIKVLNNCLDPFLQPLDPNNILKLKTRYNLGNKKVLIAVTRYSILEKYKGYDHVIKVMPKLIEQFPNLVYLLIGKYDQDEKQRIEDLATLHGVAAHIIFSGFINESELADHFGLGDVFVMPSEKEGFGIVFIESLFYGIPVVAGNIDGTVDALLNGKLGKLVEPNNKELLLNAISNSLVESAKNKINKALLMEHFSFDTYSLNIKRIIFSKN